MNSKTPIYASIPVLIVDDQEIMLSILHKTLEILGFTQITRARSGSEALAILRQEPINLVFSDYEMPNMSGVELIQQVKQNYPDIKCLIISANATEQHVSSALDAGADNYLLKPFTPAVLEQKIKHLLTSKSPDTPLDLLNETLDALDEINSPEQKDEHQTLIGLPDHLSLDVAECRVLVVDDTPTNLQVMLSALKDKCKTLVANHGQKCLEISRGKIKPDLILLDIMMPDLDGYEVCKRLKSDPNTQDIPIVFLSSMDQPGAIAKGLKLGAIDFIHKPVDADILQLRVENHLKLKLLLDHLKQAQLELIDQLKQTCTLSSKTNSIEQIADALEDACQDPQQVLTLAEQLRTLTKSV